MSLTEMSDNFFPAVTFRGHPLTDRQLGMLELLGKGYSNREISEILMLSIRTVESHLHRLRTLIAKATASKSVKINDRQLVLFAKEMLDGYEAYKALQEGEEKLTSFQAQKCQVV
jgi:DNA-binding CsgD family transcriptional regulator